MGSILVEYEPKPSHMDPVRGMFDVCFPHSEALSGCIRGQEFVMVRPNKSFNNLKDLIT